MSEERVPWWAFWRKKKTKKAESSEGGSPASSPTSRRGQADASRPTAELAQPARGDVDSTLDLHVSDIAMIDDGTVDIRPEPQESTTVQLSEEERQARLQAARERAARHKGRFGVGVPSSDALPAASAPPPEAPAPEPKKPLPKPPSSALFGGTLLILVLLFSLPLWISSFSPLNEIPGHIGLVAGFQQLQTNPLAPQWFLFSPSFYVGSLGDYLLALVGAVFSLTSLIPVLLQLYLLASLLAFLYLLHVTERSIWNVCFGLFFLLNGTFLEGNLSFLMATPLLIFGWACIYQWMHQDKGWAALATTSVAFGLLFLDIGAYLLFLVAVVCAAFVLSDSKSKAIGRLMIPTSSLVLFVPWLLVLAGAKVAHYGANPNAAFFSWRHYHHKLSTLSAPHPALADPKGAMLLAALWVAILASALVFLVQPSDRPSKARERALFPSIALASLLAYFLMPQQWSGVPLSGSAALACCSLSLVGWIHVDPRTGLGKTFLAAALGLGFFFSLALTQNFHKHHKQTQSLQWLVQQVPPGKRLLVWKLPQAPGALPSQHQAGGIYMSRKGGGLSNIDLSGHLRWRILSYKRPMPSPRSAKTPTFRNWDYLLTGWKPPQKQRPFFRVERSRGAYILYRIQVP